MSLYQDHEGSHRGVSACVTISTEDRAFADRQESLQRHLAWQSRIRVAHQKVIAIAMELAQDGLPGALVVEALRVAGEQAGKEAADYIRDFDEAEARALADELADAADDYAYGADEEVHP